MYYIAKMSDEEETDSIISDNESIDYTSENDDEHSDDLEDENYQPSEDEEQSDDETIEGEQDDEAPPEPDYKPKFLAEQRMNYLAQFHPEEIHKSFDDIHKLSTIQRDSAGVIIDENHKTYPILSKFELTKIIGLRVTQLNKGSDPYIEVKTKNILDNSLIAEKELREKKLPFIIMRPLPNGNCEYWDVNDLEYI
jgi:DNA-directed RNA polymerase I, II, and III subunit RPABC2